MTSLKQIIVDAVLRVSSDPKYKGRSYETPEEARDDFARALIAELFPESPEMAKQEESVMIPMLEEKKPVVEAEKPAEPKFVKQRVKPGPKPKPKPEGPVNIEKLNPTQTKKLKAAGVEFGVELDKKAFVAYLNGLDPEEFDNKKFEDHVKDYYASLAPAAAPVKEEPVFAEVETVVVEFEGETYYVDPKTKKVYKEEGDVDVYVGDVGLAKFADMEIPEDE